MKKEEKYTLKDFFSNMFWALKWVYSFSKVDTFLMLGTFVILAFEPIIGSYLFAQILNNFVESLAQDTQSIYSALEVLYPWFLAYGLHDIFQRITMNLNYYLSSKLNVVYEKSIYTEVYWKISTLDFSKHEDGAFNDKMKKANENLGRITDLYSTMFSTMSDFITLIGSLAILLLYSPILAIILLAFSIPITLFELRYTIRRRTMYESLVQMNRQYWFAVDTLVVDKSITEIRANNIAKNIYEYMKNKLKIKAGKELAYYKDYAKGKVKLSFLSIEDVISGLVIINKVITTGGSIGDLSFQWSRARSISNLVRKTLSNLVFMYDRSKVLKYIRDIMETENEIMSGSEKLKSNQPPKIEFRNVSFKYPKSKKYALKNLSFTINPYDEIAIIGLNGAGKTTLIKLLLRFYDPTSGQILINGIPINKVALETYYSLIGILFQDYNKYSYMTIGEAININKTKYTKGTIEDALKLAEIYEDIDKLPKKTKHKLSKWFDDGMNFSKGQEQKLALSRIFYRNAPILILDEPTSSIDSDAEARIFNKIYNHYKDKTIVIISHRFNTIKNAQRILVLKDGKLIEEGSHKKLMELKGQYYDSFNIQAKGYTDNN